MCRPFKETGECKYGEKCQFAHGEHELRTVQRHPKYKTEYCRTFYGVGLCPYGSRCHFVHDLSGDEGDNTQPRQNRSNGRSDSNANGGGQRHFNGASKEDAAIASSNRAGFGRSITSAEVDAITKAAQTTITARSFGRSASVLNSNSVASVAAHPLPMSPPLSMSTGSDRASPISSLSPTNSMASFPFTATEGTFHGPTMPTQSTSIFAQTTIHHHITPPASPPVMMSVTPPSTPTILPIASANVIAAPKSNSSAADKGRLPIFNQISCVPTMDALKNLPL